MLQVHPQTAALRRAGARLPGDNRRPANWRPDSLLPDIRKRREFLWEREALLGSRRAGRFADSERSNRSPSSLARSGMRGVLSEHQSSACKARFEGFCDLLCHFARILEAGSSRYFIGSTWSDTARVFDGARGRRRLRIMTLTDRRRPPGNRAESIRFALARHLL